MPGLVLDRDAAAAGDGGEVTLGYVTSVFEAPTAPADGGELAGNVVPYTDYKSAVARVIVLPTDDDVV